MIARRGQSLNVLLRILWYWQNVHGGSSPWPFWLKSYLILRPRVSQDLLIRLSATQLSLFLCIPFVLMATDRAFEDAVHTTLLGSPAPFSSNVGSPYGSAPDLERTVSRSITMEENINEIYLQLPLFLQNAARIGNCVQTLAQTVAAQTTKKVLNKLFGASWLALPRWKQMQLPPQAVPARQALGTHSDIVTARQPLVSRVPWPRVI